MTADNEGTADIKTSPDAAMSVISQHIIPVNESAPVNAFVEPETLPKLESGTLKVICDDVLQTGRSFKGSKLYPENPCVINQFSGYSRETIRTLIKRYGSKLKPMHSRQRDLSYTQLCNGLSMAVYGNSYSFEKLIKELKCTDTELKYHYKQYLISMQKKIGTTQEAAALRNLHQY